MLSLAAAEFLGFEIDEGAMPSSPSIELGIADQVDDVVSGDPSSSVPQMVMSCHHLRGLSLLPQMVQLLLKVFVYE